jgi:hypothetical protein
MGEYPWRDPRGPDTLRRAVTWVCYLSHQLCSLLCVYVAKRSRSTGTAQYTTKLSPANIWALGMNFSFFAMRFVHSAWSLDGLSGELPFWAPELAGLLIVIVIMLMENESRGLVFGWRWPLHEAGSYLAKRYHGYIFSFFIVQALWYHPTLSITSHAVEYAHLALLLTQSSLFYTRQHLNPYWKALLETMIVLHAIPLAETPLSIYTLVPESSRAWCAFLFGLLIVICATPLFGLPAYAKLRSHYKVVPILTVLGSIIGVYYRDSFKDLQLLLLIPGLLYMGTMVFSSALMAWCAVVTVFSERNWSRARRTELAILERYACYWVRERESVCVCVCVCVCVLLCVCVCLYQ